MTEAKQNAICRKFLSAALATASTAARKRFAGAAVLGDELSYTVELRDRTQIHVGREHCKYCARTAALMQLQENDDERNDQS